MGCGSGFLTSIPRRSSIRARTADGLDRYIVRRRNNCRGFYVNYRVCAGRIAVYLIGSVTRRFSWAVLAIVVAAFLVGAARYAVGTEVPADDMSKTADSIKAFDGMVVSEPNTRIDHVRLIIRADRARTDKGWMNVSGCVEVSISGAAGMPGARYGDRLDIAAPVYLPESPPTPGNSPGPITWPAREYMLARRCENPGRCTSCRAAAAALS